MPVEMKQGTLLTCECCDALFEIKKACTCQQKQDFICACGERLVPTEARQSPP